MKRTEVIGLRFGRLVVMQEAGKNKYGQRLVKCICDCGNEKITILDRLKSKSTLSCGCLHKETLAGRNKIQTTATHHETKTRLHNIWTGMKQRCSNPNHKSYKNYGGRGISVCVEWQESYQAFRNWAIKNGYQDSLTIDRIDNDKGYCPGNCRWTTMQEQARNKRPRQKGPVS